MIWLCQGLTKLFPRQFQVLVCTDCAGMGVHVPGLNCVVNIGESITYGLGIKTDGFEQDYQGTCGRLANRRGGLGGIVAARQPVSQCTGPVRKVLDYTASILFPKQQLYQARARLQPESGLCSTTGTSASASG